LLALSALTACGEASVILRLAHVDDDPGLAGVTTLAALLSHGGEELASASGPANAALELGTFDRPTWIDTEVDGKDVTGTIVAKGRKRVFMPERGAACCIEVCFCSLPVRDAALCTCDAALCDDPCE
jgi:hypothetical protein